MSRGKPVELQLTRHEISVQEARFDSCPFSIVDEFRRCFDEAGRQTFAVPQHLLEALAGRLKLVVDGEAKTIDAAFGGRIGRQRQFLEALRQQHRVCFAIRNAMVEARKMTPFERGSQTPFEVAVAEVAKKLGLGVERVRRIHRAAAQPSISKNSTRGDKGRTA